MTIIPPTLETFETYRGYDIKWTGWKGPALDGKKYSQLLGWKVGTGDKLEMNLAQGSITPEKALPQFRAMIDRWVGKSET